jgi:hypothetical protein
LTLLSVETFALQFFKTEVQNALLFSFEEFSKKPAGKSSGLRKEADREKKPTEKRS